MNQKQKLEIANKFAQENSEIQRRIENLYRERELINKTLRSLEEEFEMNLEVIREMSKIEQKAENRWERKLTL